MIKFEPKINLNVNIYIHVHFITIFRNTYFSLLQGFATRFILTCAIENGGRFESQHVEQLRRLGGWADKSEVVHLYIKRIIERYSDTSGLLVAGKHTPISTCSMVAQLVNFKHVPYLACVPVHTCSLTARCA